MTFATPQLHRTPASTRILGWTKRKASRIDIRWTTPQSVSRLPQATKDAPSGSSDLPILRSRTSQCGAARTFGTASRDTSEVDEPAAGTVVRRREGRRRPARTVGAPAPRVAARVYGVELKRQDVGVLALGGRGIRLGDHRLCRGGRAPRNAGLANFEEPCEHRSEFAQRLRVVGGNFSEAVIGPLRMEGSGAARTHSDSPCRAYRRLASRLFVPCDKSTRVAVGCCGKTEAGGTVANTVGDDFRSAGVDG